MNIKILDSWLRDYLNTKASPQKIAEKLSLSSVSVERLEKRGNDFVYDIEITTNRPDLMSVIGLAREAAVVLAQNNIGAQFTPPILPSPQPSPLKGEGEKENPLSYQERVEVRSTGAGI